MLSLSTYFVAIAALTGLLNYKKFKKSIFKFFILFLVYVLFTDSLGFILNKLYVKHDHNELYNSFPVYNVYLIISFLFYFILYKNLIKKRNKKKIITILLFIYLFLTIIDLLIFKTSFVDGFIINNIIFGSILLVITVILFMIEIINDERIVFNIKKSIVFWISVGVLLFHIGFIPIMISSKLLKYDGIYDNILLGLNVIMYGSFTIGFIKSDPKFNY